MFRESKLGDASLGNRSSVLCSASHIYWNYKALQYLPRGPIETFNIETKIKLSEGGPSSQGATVETRGVPCYLATPPTEPYSGKILVTRLKIGYFMHIDPCVGNNNA